MTEQSEMAESDWHRATRQVSRHNTNNFILTTTRDREKIVDHVSDHGHIIDVF